MRTIDSIEWKETAKYIGGSPVLKPNVKIDEPFSIDGEKWKVSAIWSSGEITLKKGSDFVLFAPRYVAQILEDMVIK